MNNAFLIAIGVLVLAILLILFIIRNRKDKKEFEGQIKNDGRKFTTHDTDSGEKESI